MQAGGAGSAAPKVLFGKYDVHTVREIQKQRLKEAYRDLPDEQAMDEEVIQRLKAEYMPDVPELRPRAEWSREQNKTKVDGRGIPGRIYFPRAGPAMEDATELIIHIPFDGDPGVFNVAPSAYNSRIAQGDVVDHELLLRVVVVDGIDLDVQAQIDREVEQINWALTNLRQSLPVFSQELEGVLRQAVQNRKRSIESRSNVIGKLDIPLRAAAASVVGPESRQAATGHPKGPPQNRQEQWDVFISHASKDKPWVDGLADALSAAGINVWYDRLVLKWGDEIRTKIDHGLSNCRYGIVVFSKAFLEGKKWTEHEFNGLFALEKGNKKLILPIWHGITQDELLSYSPAFANRLAKDSSTDTYEDIVSSLLEMLDRPGVSLAKAAAKEATPQRPKPNAIAYVTYQDPEGQLAGLLIRKSLSTDGKFTLECPGGEEYEGTREDIALKYITNHRMLIRNGYKTMNVSGSSEYPDFNL